MRIFLASLAVAVVALGVPAALCLAALAGAPADPPAVLHRADGYYAVLGYLKYPAALLVLAAADRAVLREDRHGWTKAVLLWTPFVLFLAAAVLHWGVVGQAYVRFARDYGLFHGAFSADALYLAAAVPLGFVLALLNHGLVSGLQERRTG